MRDWVDGETLGSRIGSASFGSVIWTIMLRIFLIIAMAICASGCGGAENSPGENSPSSTVPALATTDSGAGGEDLAVTTTTRSSVPLSSAVTTTTLALKTSPDTTLGTADETTPSNDSTTTIALIETLTPDAETFEPEAPQSGFVTHEPNA